GAKAAHRVMQLDRAAARNAEIGLVGEGVDVSAPGHDTVRARPLVVYPQMREPDAADEAAGVDCTGCHPCAFSSPRRWPIRARSTKGTTVTAASPAAIEMTPLFTSAR